MSRSRHPKSLLLVHLLLTSVLTAACASVPESTSQTRAIRVFEGQVPAEVAFEKMNEGNEVAAKHGYGCGLFGAAGNQEGAIEVMRQQAVNAKADGVLLTRWEGLAIISGGCRENAYTVWGFLVRLPVYNYTEPMQREDAFEEFRYEVPHGFDKTWDSLVDVVASNFFEIENYEKDSGLLTLTVDPDALSEYVDCGDWSKIYPSGKDGFSGEYVDWLMLEAGASHDIKINLRVRKLSARRSEVEITARYRVNAPAKKLQFAFKTNDRRTLKGLESRAPGTPDFRTCQANLVLERGVLREIEAMAKR